MNIPGDYHTQWSKSDKEMQVSYGITYEESKKMVQMNLFTKQIYRFKEWTYGYQGRRVGSGILRVWDWHVHTDIFKTNNQQRPTVYSTGNSASYSVIT